MGSRFYVNGLQIFGNGEMPRHTFEELRKQGAVWKDDWLPEMEIKNPQALLEAVSLDSSEFFFEAFEKEKKALKDVTDSDYLYSKFFAKRLTGILFDDNSKPKKDAWREIREYVYDKRVFTPLCLYMAIKDCVEETSDGKIYLASGKKIIATMF